MPLYSLDPQVPQDGRQSTAAEAVVRGTRRLLWRLNYSTLTELPLSSGRRADIVALSPQGLILIIEVKSSVADFRADLKWHEYRTHCDQLYFAIPNSLPADILPADTGLILADAYGGHIVRPAPEHRLAGTTRRAMFLRFAHAAAQRLHQLNDHAVGSRTPIPFGDVLL